MLDIIKGSLNEGMSREEKIHLVREQLQVLILKILFDIGGFKNLAFVGGTALRIIFGLRRFSEDLPSLYATKLHACFFRKYVKGRDFYDLVWYLGKGGLPNFLLLNNAIAQTEGKDVAITEENFKEFLLEKLEDIDFARVRKDVERFLVDKEELKLLNGQLIKQILLKKRRIKDA